MWEKSSLSRKIFIGSHSIPLFGRPFRSFIDANALLPLDAGMRGGAGWRRGGGVHGGPTACMAVMVGAWRCGGGSSRGLQWPAGGPVVASMCFLLSFIDFRNSLSRA